MWMKGSLGDFKANLNAVVMSLESGSLIFESWSSLVIKTEPFLINTKTKQMTVSILLDFRY